MGRRDIHVGFVGIETSKCPDIEEFARHHTWHRSRIRPRISTHDHPLLEERPVSNTAKQPHPIARRPAALLATCALSLVFGCGSGSGSTSPTADSGKGDVEVDAGYLSSTNFISLQNGAPETVLWDDSHAVLYVVDNTGNRIWKWTDASGLGTTPYATLPAPADTGALPANVTLGQAALLADGTLVVSRFGQPGAGYGGISYVNPDGSTALVPNLNAGFRRLGLAVAPNNTLYGAYFASADGGTAGFVTTVDLHAGETVVADGFGKIVGLSVSGERLYVSDQSSAKIFDAPLSALPAHAADWHTLATLVKPDQICAGPDGSLFTGQFQGAPGSSDPISVRQISSSGAVTAFKKDPDVSKPSGLSYDPTNHRLFVADSGNSAKLGVHVFSVP